MTCRNCTVCRLTKDIITQHPAAPARQSLVSNVSAAEESWENVLGKYKRKGLAKCSPTWVFSRLDEAWQLSSWKESSAEKPSNFMSTDPRNHVAQRWRFSEFVLFPNCRTLNAGSGVGKGTVIIVSQHHHVFACMIVRLWEKDGNYWEDQGEEWNSTN